MFKNVTIHISRLILSKKQIAFLYTLENDFVCGPGVSFQVTSFTVPLVLLANNNERLIIIIEQYFNLYGKHNQGGLCFLPDSSDSCSCQVINQTRADIYELYLLFKCLQENSLEVKVFSRITRDFR